LGLEKRDDRERQRERREGRRGHEQQEADREWNQPLRREVRDDGVDECVEALFEPWPHLISCLEALTRRATPVARRAVLVSA
jgi:hypothetical protein